MIAGVGQKVIWTIILYYHLKPEMGESSVRMPSVPRISRKYFRSRLKYLSANPALHSMLDGFSPLWERRYLHFSGKKRIRKEDSLYLICHTDPGFFWSTLPTCRALITQNTRLSRLAWWMLMVEGGEE